MSDNQLFHDEVIERVREFAPVVPADVLSSTGPSAQRVLDRVLAMTARANTVDIGRAPIGTANSRARPAWLTRWRAGALTGVVTAVAVIVAVLVIAGGAGPSIVGRAYAATDPVGVIVHYVETTRSSDGGTPEVSEYWLNGPDSRQLFNANRPSSRQDIVVSGGQMRNLSRGKLVVVPVLPASSPCPTELVLNGGCSEQQNNTPVDGLRRLYRSGYI